MALSYDVMAHNSKNSKRKQDDLSEVFSFRLSADELGALERLASADRRTPSNMLRKLIAEAAGRSPVKR